MPWYPLYHEAFDLDTGSWTSEQVGCLIRLMNHQWANGSIPDAPDHLARICRIDRADWPEIWEILKPKFETTSPGRMINRRLAVEQKRTQRKSEAARKAAQIRHGKDSKIKQPDADAPADEVLSTSTTTSTGKNKREASPPLPPGLNVEAWDDWLAYRRESRWKPWVPRTIKSKTRWLCQFSKEDQREIIQQSIDNGWMGLFEIGGRNGRREIPVAGAAVERAYRNQGK